VFTPSRAPSRAGNSEVPEQAADEVLVELGVLGAEGVDHELDVLLVARAARDALDAAALALRAQQHRRQRCKGGGARVAAALGRLDAVDKLLRVGLGGEELLELLGGGGGQLALRRGGGAARRSHHRHQRSQHGAAHGV